MLKVQNVLNLAQLIGGFAMQPKTEGTEEKGPSDVPFINDPEKPTSPPLNDADATDAAEAEEDIQDDGESI
ncbi:hypothetical protein [Pseudomonas sp. BP8]|uniref:hypothetical protein n=1 Tax=Pseudomonas sp. BP8 TaxID=2817864 RepID=UPI001AE97C0D|nr:hypothetical protein [Pseudomonas sp. BP8]MBP2262824.1 hypothetical protein [Pseudomonas sp. BP8]HDS1735605.1 hypothetical protein [Pseudomonas putida]